MSQITLTAPQRRFWQIAQALGLVATVVLSTVVAAIGLLRDSSTVIIGAMVIAPLLGPNLALAFASTLGDTALIRQALRSNLIGVGITIGLTVAMGLLMSINPEIPELAARTRVSFPLAAYLKPDETLEVLPGLADPKYEPIPVITFHTRTTAKFYGDDYAVESPEG